LDTSNHTDSNKLALWRSFEKNSTIRCPVCRGALKVADLHFECLSCASVYPVESDVPLLMRPEEVVSIPSHVMKVFNIPATRKERVEAALTTLTRYRAYSHPEFANFFARFDSHEGQAQTTPLTAEDTAASIEKVESLTQYFPETLRSDKAEFRSLRLKNGSDRTLFTDERNPLYLSYRVFTLSGVPIPFESSRSPLPCPLKPGSELTVPVMVKLPEGLTGQFIVRFYFLLANRPATENDHTRTGKRGVLARSRLFSWGGGRRSFLHDEKPADQLFCPAQPVQWFEKSPLVEMRVTAIAEKAEFPAILQDNLDDFDVQEDVTRAENFLSEVIGDLRSCGVSKPCILEVGAGVYPISLRTCDEDTTVVVSDISLVMQMLASVMHTDNPAVLEGRAAFASFDMMYPPFQDSTFDVICICAALHHIPSPDMFLRRLAPLLSRFGRFVAVREPCLVNPSEPTYIAELSNGFNEQMFELAEWDAIISRGGLTIDRAVIDFGCSLKFSARVPCLNKAT
jgi:SAM-dependent methyltransferase